MTYRRPGVSFSITSFVASGVTSLGVKPVPPKLKIHQKGKESGKEKPQQIFTKQQKRCWTWKTLPSVRTRSTWSTSLHLCRTSLILDTSSGTTAVATIFAPPNLSDDELTTETALGPLQIRTFKNQFNHKTMMISVKVLSIDSKWRYSDLN